MKDTIKNNLQKIIWTGASLLVGLLIGWFAFSGSEGDSSSKTSENETEASLEKTGKAEVWTCSMHPQIRQDEAGDCPICGMDLIPLSDNSDTDNPIQLVMTKEAVKLAQVETMIVGRSDNNKEAVDYNKNKEIFLTGKVKMDATKSATQTAHINGRLERLLVSFEGEQVRKNQKIAVLYAPELINAQKELLEAIKIKAEYPGLYKAARQKIRQWKLPETTIDAIEKSGQIEENVTIYAERSGILMKRYVEEGDYVKQGSPLFDIMDLNQVWVLFDVYEKDLRWVKVGTTIAFNLDVMPEKTYRSKISFIDPIINPKTRVASARVELSNRKGLLKPEMFAKGIVAVNMYQKKNASALVTVPKTAVLWTGQRSVVYVKVADVAVPTFEFRVVSLGTDLGQYFVIEEGLVDGEEVVVNGVFRLDAAAQLNNKNSMMNRLVTVKEAALAEDQLPNYQSETSEEFKGKLREFVDNYLDLKERLVATDFEAARKQISELSKSLKGIDMSLLKGEGHLFWMEKMAKIQGQLQALNEAKNIEGQRASFALLSELLVQVVKVFGLTESTLFIQYCPMALDNEGANWLSKEETVQNPYFGDKMLRCGSVEVSLTF
jgi:Cu(I)/Ag(I) efflux system membrane fusion protein